MSTAKELMYAKLAANIDGEAGSIRDMMDESTKSMHAETIVVLGNAAEKISGLLIKATEDKAPASVIACYEKLLAGLAPA